VDVFAEVTLLLAFKGRAPEEDVDGIKEQKMEVTEEQNGTGDQRTAEKIQLDKLESKPIVLNDAEQVADTTALRGLSEAVTDPQTAEIHNADPVKPDAVESENAEEVKASSDLNDPDVIAISPIKRETTPPPASSPVKRSLPLTPQASFSAFDMDIPQQSPFAAPSTIESFAPHATKTLHPISTFNNVTIWHPDTLPDLGDDVYAKSINEWCSLSLLVSLMLPIRLCG